MAKYHFATYDTSGDIIYYYQLRSSGDDTFGSVRPSIYNPLLFYIIFQLTAERVDNGSWFFKPSTAKRSHETQNQPNTLLNGSVTNPCVCNQ